MDILKTSMTSLYFYFGPRKKIFFVPGLCRAAPIVLFLPIIPTASSTRLMGGKYSTKSQETAHNRRHGPGKWILFLRLSQAEYTAMDDVTDSSKMSTNTRPSAANTPGAELQDVIKLLDLSSTAGPLAQLKGRKPMAEISIPGMSTIFGDASVCRRVVWCFFMVVCITIATIQVQDRVRYYLSVPVAVNVRVTMKDSLRFPAFTVCNKNPFNISEFRRIRAKQIEVSGNANETSDKIHLIVGFEGMDAKQVWDQTAHRSEYLIKECWFGRNINCNQVGKWQTVYTYMGVCYSFLLDNHSVKTTGMFNHLYLKLHDPEKLVYKDDPGWKILIHDRRDTPVIDVRTHGNTLNRGWGKDIRIYIREFKTLNTWGRPCEEDGSYSQCISECFEAVAASKMTCRLPFMNISWMNYCSTPQSYRANEKIVDELVFYGRWSSSQCHCQRRCEQDIYVPSTETYQMTADEKNLSKIRLYYQDFTFDDIEESYDYGAVSLLCDIGGSLGFLLGVSVLTLFEIVDAMARAMVRLMRQLFNKCRQRAYG